MANTSEALEILIGFDLPKAQRGEVAQWTLIALANVTPQDQWGKSSKKCLRIHDIMQFISAEHDKEYAENSRETFRKQVLHQFEQASIVTKNPDAPSRPTNSPNTCYALTTESLNVIRNYATSDFKKLCTEFLAEQGSLQAKYRKKRELNKVPVTLPNGSEFKLSPGEHNILQVAVVEEFTPAFIPGAVVLYLGDTADKLMHIESEELELLGIPVTKHDKLPDILFYVKKRNLLVLVEVVTSHGPVSSKRYEELEEVLSNCKLQRVFVTAFPDFKIFKQYISELAWGTEVWVRETPTHIIHFNGPNLYLVEK